MWLVDLRRWLWHGWVSCLPLQQSRSCHIILYTPQTCSEWVSLPLVHAWTRLAWERKRYRRYKRTWLHSDLVLFRHALDDAYEAIESANLLFYCQRLSALHNSKQIWTDLRNLSKCSSGFDSPSTFSADELNAHFSKVSFNLQAPPISDYLDDLAEPEDYFSRFSFREVTMNEVNRTKAHSNSQARETDNIPQSFISTVTPVIGSYLLKIFNCSIH